MRLDNLIFFSHKKIAVIAPFGKNVFRFNGRPIWELRRYLNSPLLHLVQGSYPHVPLLGIRLLLQHYYSCFALLSKKKFEHFVVEGHSMKVVKRVIENTIIIKN
jgi:hypothetical protein